MQLVNDKACVFMPVPYTYSILEHSLELYEVSEMHPGIEHDCTLHLLVPQVSAFKQLNITGI